MNGKRKNAARKDVATISYISLICRTAKGGWGSRTFNPSCTEYPRASMRKNGESNSERCQVDQGDQSAVSGGEDHQDTDIRLEVLEGAVLRPLV